MSEKKCIQTKNVFGYPLARGRGCDILAATFHCATPSLTCHTEPELCMCHEPEYADLQQEPPREAKYWLWAKYSAFWIVWSDAMDTGATKYPSEFAAKRAAEELATRHIGVRFYTLPVSQYVRTSSVPEWCAADPAEVDK